MDGDDERSWWEVAQMTTKGGATVRLVFFSAWLVFLAIGAAYGFYCRWFNWQGMIWGVTIWLTVERFTDALAKWLVSRQREEVDEL